MINWMKSAVVAAAPRCSKDEPLKIYLFWFDSTPYSVRKLETF